MVGAGRKGIQGLFCSNIVKQEMGPQVHGLVVLILFSKVEGLNRSYDVYGKKSCLKLS